MQKRQSMFRSFAGIALAGVSAVLLSGCDERTERSGRAWRPIPGDTLALMSQIGTNKRAPVLIRTYKKEAEFEIWKMKADGRYALLKTFPMCRWSGQLGPKVREGDRQVPEGFYNITPTQMNPNSNYYLSFNVGYPNALDRSFGRTGGSIMVHGACSSAGCYSMTDDQIAEIYAIAREAFGGGQAAIQMQSLPFRMNAENLAKHRVDPNIGFWKQLKEGVDHFDVTKQEPLVNVCNRRYVFNSTPIDPKNKLDANSICPPLQQDEALKAEVAAKQARDNEKVAELVHKGVTPIKIRYADGGQHPVFAQVSEVSRPDALAEGPTEIELLENGKPKPALVQIAAAKARSKNASSVQAAALPAAADTSTAIARTPTPAAAAGTAIAGQSPAAAPLANTAAAQEPAPKPGSPFYKRWLGLAAEAPESEAVKIIEPAVPQTVDVPLPPRRAASPTDAKPHAALDMPQIIRGAQPVLPNGFMAYAAVAR